MALNLCFESYTIHYKILGSGLYQSQIEQQCEDEAAKYGNLFPITLPTPTNEYENAQFYEILKSTTKTKLWLGVKKTEYGFTIDGDGNRQLMDRANYGSWSEDPQAALMCVFVDYTDLSNSVCTKVSVFYFLFYLVKT